MDLGLSALVAQSIYILSLPPPVVRFMGCGWASTPTIRTLPAAKSEDCTALILETFMQHLNASQNNSGLAAGPVTVCLHKATTCQHKVHYKLVAGTSILPRVL